MTTTYVPLSDGDAVALKLAAEQLEGYVRPQTEDDERLQAEAALLLRDILRRRRTRQRAGR